MKVGTRFYGRFVRIDACYKNPEVTEPRFTHWIRMDNVPASVDELQLNEHGHYDYGMMAEWCDTKLVEVAERWGNDATAERLRARKARLTLEGHYAKSVETYEAFYHLTGFPLGTTAPTAGAHVLPKLLCGFYGGYFLKDAIPYSMGFGPYLKLHSTTDGQTRHTSDQAELDNF